MIGEKVKVSNTLCEQGETESKACSCSFAYNIVHKTNQSYVVLTFLYGFSQASLEMCSRWAAETNWAVFSQSIDQRIRTRV